MGKNFTFLFITIFCCLWYQRADCGQITFNGSANWAAKAFESKVFIENLGQFDGKDQLSNSHISYGVDSKGSQIYFTPRGLTYRFDKTEKQNSEEPEKQPEITTTTVHVEFINASPTVQLITAELSPDYYNYTENPKEKCFYHARAYKKLIYKNLYPGIDAVYTFHQTEGIKYAFIVHAGADASMIQMRYNGADGIKTDASGNILITTAVGDITDHAPVTYYAGDKSSVASAFQLMNNDVTFSLQNYNHSKTIVIDPWSVFPAFGGSGNTSRVFNVKGDPFGNVYIYGSYNICKLAKYNSAGALQWMVNTPYGLWLGGVAPDNSGNVYISGLYGVTEYDSTGVVIFNTNLSGHECWRLVFDPTFTRLYVGGDQAASVLYRVSAVDGSILDTNNIGGADEVRAMCTAPNGNIYSVIVGGAMIAADSLLNNIYTASSGGSLLYRPTYGNPPPPSSTTCSENSICADNNFVYCTDGRIVAKINISTGAIIKSVVVSGVSTSQLYSGIAVDPCGNVYVGSNHKVVEYDPTLTQIATFATSGVVYDVSITPGGILIAGGQDFVASLGSVLTTCTVLSTSATTQNVSCNGQCNGSAIVTPLNGSSPYTYSWSNGQTTQSISGLCPGTYSVNVHDALSASSTSTVNITQPTVLSVTTSGGIIPLCYGANNGSLTAVPIGGTTPYTYSWSNGATSQTATSLASGTYSVAVKDKNGCADTFYTVLAQNPPIVLNFKRYYDICAEGGSTQLTASGGTSYTWSPSTGLDDTTVANPLANPLVTTTYIVTVSDGTCSDTAHVTVNLVPPSAPPVISQFGDSLSVLQNYLSYQWYFEGSPISSASMYYYIATQTGHYSIYITDSNGCNINSSGLMITVGINSISDPDGEIIIYPNPAKEGLWLVIQGLWVGRRTMLEIENVMGEIVYRADLKTPDMQPVTKIDISTFSDGIYLLKVMNGEKVVVKKLVIEK